MSENLITIHLALGANERYFPGLYCAVGSALRSLGSGYRAMVHVIDAGVSAESRKTLEDLVDTGNEHSISWLPAPVDRFRRIQIAGYHPAVLHRLALPELLPDVERAIYLDADTLVFDCLGKLWEESNNRKEPLFAVQDCETMCIAGDSKTLASILGLERTSGYFNSGMLLLRLDELRKEDFTCRACEFLEKHGSLIRFPDQTVLNCHFAERWGSLEARWNFPAWAFDRQYGNDLPAICHFTNHAPWLFRRYTPSQALFERTARELELALPNSSLGLLAPCWAALVCWSLAPLRWIYQTTRIVIGRIIKHEDEAKFAEELARYWRGYFLDGPRRVLHYGRRIRSMTASKPL